jgi:hypothetical protein
MTEPTTLPAVEESCNSCRFWKPGRFVEQDDDPLRGQCRRYPLMLGDSIWPVTDEDDWCGEYREKAKENGPLPPSA